MLEIYWFFCLSEVNVEEERLFCIGDLNAVLLDGIVDVNVVHSFCYLFHLRPLNLLIPFSVFRSQRLLGNEVVFFCSAIRIRVSFQFFIKLVLNLNPGLLLCLETGMKSDPIPRQPHFSFLFFLENRLFRYNTALKF